MANKFSNDEIRTSILFETDKGQQKIHKLGKTIDELDAKRKLHLKTMAEEERKGRQGSDVWKAAKKQYDELGKQIKKNREEIDEETKALNINDMAERVVASDKTLEMVKKIYRKLWHDVDSGRLDWLMRGEPEKAEIVPFVASELNSYGWTLLFATQGADTLDTKTDIADGNG